MKINWKIRLKNPVFWLTIIPALAAFMYAILAALDIAPAIAQGEVVSIATAVITALATLGVLVDPTTAGINDSSQAMNYDEPKKEAE